jgi:hypothetical protein
MHSACACNAPRGRGLQEEGDVDFTSPASKGKKARPKPSPESGGSGFENKLSSAIEALAEAAKEKATAANKKAEAASTQATAAKINAESQARMMEMMLQILQNQNARST